MRQLCLSLLLTACYILSIDFVAAQTVPSNEADGLDSCVRMYSEVDDGTGFTDRCCSKWRVNTCYVNTASFVLRESTLNAAKISMQQGGCQKWANRVGGSMPAACYWKYRLWVPITIGVLISILVVSAIVSIVCFVSRRKRNSESAGNAPIAEYHARA